MSLDFHCSSSLIRTCCRARNAEELWPRMLNLWSLTSSNNFWRNVVFPSCLPFHIYDCYYWSHNSSTGNFPGVTGLLCLTSSLLDLCASEASLDVSKCGLSWSSASVQALLSPSSTARCWTPWWLTLKGISVSCTPFSELRPPGFAGSCTNQQRLEEMGKTLKENKQKTSGAENLLFSQHELLQEFG